MRSTTWFVIVADSYPTVVDGVYRAEGDVIPVSRLDIVGLINDRYQIKTRRGRLCVHKNDKTLLQEMFIVLDRTSYIRPHRHRGKIESLCVLEGKGTAIFFDDEGGIAEVIRLSPYGVDESQFFYRLEAMTYHTILVESDYLVFHEVSEGPFEVDESEFAPWSPDANNEYQRNRYCSKLRALLSKSELSI
jgi:cupin fold WbuC family metalloprotein